jgi:hypothetical protein
MANQMWMGNPLTHMQWVPCPNIDSVITRNRYVERMKFQNGGGDVARSSQYQTEYNLNLTGPANELEGIDAFNRFASGFYGDGYIYVAHPALFESNLFSAQWSSPGLIEEGWKNIYPTTTPTFANTASNTRSQPIRSATWSVTSAVNTPVYKFTIPIPAGYTLNLGASGSRTGTAVVQVLPILIGGAVAATSNLTLLDATAATRMNATFSGGTYWGVDVYITRTSTATSTITLTSLMAQLYKSSASPTLPTSHIMGQGASGMMFADDAIVENYSYMFPPRKGISTTLVEVEAWR